MIVLLLIAAADGWTERNHPTFAAFTLQQGPRYATTAEGEWWSASRERMESLKLAASQLGYFRPDKEAPCWEATWLGVPASWSVMGFMNVIRMRAQGVIPPDGHP